MSPSSRLEMCLSVFAFAAFANLAAQQVRHQLLAVADAQDGWTRLRKIAGSTVGLPAS